MKRSSFKLTLAAILAAFALVPLPIGCSLQGEGERCDIRNYDPSTNANLDCAAGLVCVPASQLGGQADICCPSNGGVSAKYDCLPHGNTTSSSGAGGGSSSSSTGGGGAGGAGSSSASSSASASTSTSTSTSASTSASTSSSSGGPDAGP